MARGWCLAFALESHAFEGKPEVGCLTGTDECVVVVCRVCFLLWRLR